MNKPQWSRNNDTKFLFSGKISVNAETIALASTLKQKKLNQTGRYSFFITSTEIDINCFKNEFKCM